MKNPMYELSDQLKTLRDEKKGVEERLKRLNAAIAEVDEKLSDMMGDTDTRNFTHADTMFYLINKTRASATDGRKDDLFAALKAQGYGGLVQETVTPSSLAAFVKEQIAEHDGEHVPDWLEGLVNVFNQTTVGVRKAAK